MTPAGFSTPLIHRQWLTDTVVELHFSRPDGFRFEPGQRLRICHDALERDYSLASAPGDPELRLLVRVFPEGRGSTYLSRVESGQPISFYGPRGYFVYRESPRTAVFVATGTGVAPFLSMCRTGVSGFICLHGAKDRAGLLHAAVLEKQATRYVPCLSSSADSSSSDFAGRVTDYLGGSLAPGDYDFYLCGHQEMIRDAFQIIDERFEQAHVHSEVFY